MPEDVPAAPDAFDPSVVAITKTTTQDEVNAGDSFSYQLTPSCSGLTTGCVGMTVTDTIPPDLIVDEAALVAQSNPPAYTITYDEATRTVTIVYGQDLDNPPGTTGWPAGTTAPQINIPVRVPDDTVIPDGSSVTNEAVIEAENAPAEDDSVDVTVHIPRILRPIVGKEWKDGSAVAGSGEDSTISLNVKNESSPTAEVDELTVSDTTSDTFEYFDLTGVTVTRFPDGADQATLTVNLEGGGTATATATPPPPATFTLPPGVDPADVVGVEVTFSNSNGDPLPYDATGGSVDLGLTLRDTIRSTGDPLRPTDRITVNNCATPSATDPVLGTVTGTDGCASYDILPDTLVLGGSKQFFPDTDGSWSQDAGEYAVLGTDSPVTALVDVQNKSPFPVREISITEPDPDQPSEIDKVDIEQVRLRFPAGATQGVLEVTCKDGSTPPAQTYTSDAEVDVAALCPGGVASVTVTYTGVDADGNPTIEPGATAGLDIHGPLNGTVTEEDVSNGIRNCAAYSGDAGRTDGSGTATGAACVDLPIELPDFAGDGTKEVGQTDVPPGQPIPFHIEWTNTGNVGLFFPTISDPRVDAVGRPVADGNPFQYLEITSIDVSIDPDLPITVEVYDPVAGSWVAYDGVDPAVLERATGFRVRVLDLAPPLTHVTIDVVTERRDDAPDDITFDNCVTTGIFLLPNIGKTYCSDQLTTGPAEASASLNKSISPSELPQLVPGLPRQYATVDLTIVNTGNLSANQLQMTDLDTDFFDAVDFVDFTGVTFPPDADRVQIDAYAGGAWVNGEPSTTAALPAGVSAADVTGIRATFTSTSTDNDGYVITPCEVPATCGGHVTFRVSPRQDLRSAPGTPIPDHLEDTVSGSFTTKLDDEPRDIDDSTATLDLVPGDPKLAVDKSPNSELAPGQTALFNLKVTNTGTANIHDLVVDDVLPEGIAFDSTFVGDNGQPFKVVDTQVPDGTPDLPFPTFTVTNDGDRVSRLSWDFGTQEDGTPYVFPPGATFTIQIRVGLEPGVTAGQVVTNTMGATGSDDDLACDGATDPDDLFGDGTWCTDDATLTTQSGASFAARKWVAGRDSLGWYNTTTGEHVGVGDASCPSTTQGGRTFTAYPCVALVDPGDRFTYLLRLQNAGTEPGRDLRIVDRLPVVGDKGVFVDQDRGTEWANRPTLASEPVLDGPGTLTSSYSNSEPLCTDDLDMGGVGSSAAQCPASAWDDPFSAAAVGIRMAIHFDPYLAPGGTVNITFEMLTPLDVPRVSDPTIAWNSYAHAEVTDRAGQPNVLPVTEPVKVGVATAYGALRLDKVIGENPDSLPVYNIPFPIHVVCVINPQGGTQQTVLDETYNLVPSDPAIVIHGIPGDADCTITETDAQGGVLPDPITVHIPPSYGTEEIVEATVVNNFPDAILVLRKVVTGPGSAYAPTSFPVDVYCSFDGQPVEGYNPLSTVIISSRPRFVADVPPGSQCYVVETDPGGATEVTFDPPGDVPGQSGIVTTADGEPVTIRVENDFRTGGILVEKDVVGAGAPSLAQGPFTFHVACTFNGQENAFETDVTIPEGDGTQTSFTAPLVEGIPAGPEGNETTCTVTETDNGGADETPPPVEVTIVPDEDVLAQFTTDNDRPNPFSAGTIGLTKVVDGDLADEDWVADATFTVQVTCQLDTTDADGNPVRATVYSEAVTIKAGETIDALPGPDGEPVLLPVGTHCFGEETGDGGATSASVDHTTFDDGLVVTAQDDPDQPQPLMLTATNVFDATAVAVTKKVDGSGAAEVGDTTFTIEVSCVLDQGGAEPTPIITGEEHTLVAGETVTIDGLPVGAQCWAVETDDGGADDSSVTNDSLETAVELVAGETAQITVTNTFDANEGAGGGLAQTGASLLQPLAAGLAALVLGLLLVLYARRRSGAAVG